MGIYFVEQGMGLLWQPVLGYLLGGRSATIWRGDILSYGKFKRVRRVGGHIVISDINWWRYPSVGSMEKTISKYIYIEIAQSLL